MMPMGIHRKKHPLTIVECPKRMQAALRDFYESRPDLTINEWARRSKVSEGTFRKFFTTPDGTMKLSTLEKLARGAETTVDQMLGYSLRPQVPLVGKIGAGAVVSLFDGAVDQGFDRGETVDAPEGIANPDEIVALEIEGDSMYPFRAGWRVFYCREHDGVTDDEVGKLCVIKCKNGLLVIKELKRGRLPGRFNLESWNAPSMDDVEVEWACAVRSIVQT